MAAIAPGDVQLWWIDLDQPADVRAALAGLLADDERARAARFARPELQRRFVVGRGALRALLGHHLGAAPRAIDLRYGPHGKPELAGEAALRFNLSHSEGRALLAVTRRAEVGVDVEAIRSLRDRDRIAGRTFTRRENAALAGLPPGLSDAGFFACWTRKEAVVKTTGIGFAFELDWFDVPVDPALDKAEIVVRGESAVAGRYGLWNLAAPAGFAAALALRRPAEDPAALRLVSRSFQPWTLQPSTWSR